MPLWGRKLYQPRANGKRKNSKPPLFSIPFTEEVFDSETEYKEQLALYQQPLWTCQSSGRSGLTYEEAHMSEVKNKDLLKETIPAPLQKAILQLVHHSSGTLDALVQRVEDHLNSQFHIGEVVELAKCKGKIVKGRILQVKTDQGKACNGSPSSDKENHSLEPELLLNSKPSKNVPQYYNIQIIGKENKVISSVPASDLIRCNDSPSPDHIALLIRSYALQAGTKQSSPWVVTPDVVKSLGIRNKLIETMLPSTRISIQGLKGAVKRRATNEGATNQQNKKQKLENGGKKDGSSVNGSHTPATTDSCAVMVVDMDSEEYRDCSLPPSPEKVFLDHSYSSPQSKANKAPPSPKEKAKKPSPTAKSSKLAGKSSILKAMEAVKKTDKQSKEPTKTAKKSQVKARKDSVGKIPPKKKPKNENVGKEQKKEKIKDEVVIIGDSSSDSDSDTSSDSDIILLDLSKKLSPKKDKKLVVPVRRTLADHFLSLSKRKTAKETAGRTLDAKGSKWVGESEGSKNVKMSPKVKRDDSTGEKEEIGGREKKDENSTEKPKKGSKNEKGESRAGTKPVMVSLEKEKGTKLSRKEVKRDAEEEEEKKVKRTSLSANIANKNVKKTPPKSLKSKEQQKTSKASLVKSSPKKSLSTPIKAKKTPVKKGTLSTKSPLKTTKVSPKKKSEMVAKKLVKGSAKTKSPLKTKSPVKPKSPLKSAKVSPKKPAGKKTPVKSKTSPLKSPKSKKSMKQVTLFNFSTKKKVQPEYSSSDDDALILYKVAKPATPVTPREPKIVAKLMKAKRTNQKQYNRLVCQAAKLLTKKQIQVLKPLIQQDVMNKVQVLEARNKWLEMTPEERKKVLDARRKKQKQEERKKRQAEEKEKAKRYEDQLLDLSPLVVPKPVALPEGLPNTLFGDIAMVVEFLNCYSGFLMPNDPYPVTTDSFMKALVCGKEGFAYLSRMLVILLKTLLQDQITEHFMDLGMKLSDIPINMHTASELLRLSLRQTDAEEEQTDDDSDTSSVAQEEGEFTAPQELVELLETTEFFSLTPEVKLELMVCVCNRILSTYSLVDYMDDKQRKATKLWNQKMQTLKLKNDQKREEKKKLKEEREAAQRQKKEEEERLKAEKEKNGGKLPDDLKPAKKKAKKEEPKETSAAPPAPPPAEVEPDDLASIVKRRRILAARAKLEQEQQAKKDLERRLQEQEEMKLQKEKQIFEKNFEEGIHLAKIVLRQQPVGTDRNHSRYWVFSTVTPGLFIEKGWASQDIDYSCATSGEDGQEDTTEVSENSESDKTKLEDGVEKSIPKQGQNLWFHYDSMKEVDALMECLNNAGIRESALHHALEKRYNEISKLIFQSRRSGLQLRDSDGPKELLDSFKEDLKDIETHVRQGHLGGVANFEKWEKRLESATKMKELSSLLLESQASVNPKFLQNIMAPQRSKVKQEDEDDEAEEVEERSDKLVRWIESVKTAPTMSRLHVLLSIFEVCIKWEKSSENARCKICRKKGDASQILLCDDCNQPFHSFCLRPALSFPPPGKWKCPSCAPMSQRAGRKRNYKDMLESESEEEDEENSSEEVSDDDNDDDEDNEDDGEASCCVCGMGDETISCSQCDLAYHKDCHEPPMRNFPRGKWTCYSCIHGKKKGRGKRKRTR